MSDEQTIKFPLSKKNKAQFVADYEKIFFKVPPHNISDEKLVEVVNANREKIGSNEGTQNPPSQEGIQDAKNGEGDGTTDAKGDGDNNGDGINPEDGTGANGDGKISPDDERLHQLAKFKELHGEDADENLSTSEITALNLTKENFLTGSKEYFDLFGKQPLEGMTNEQIFSAIANEKARQAEAKSKVQAKAEPIDDSLDYNPETEMLIVNKKNDKDKRVINKSTFDFLKHDFDEVVQKPKELQNKI